MIQHLAESNYETNETMDGNEFSVKWGCTKPFRRESPSFPFSVLDLALFHLESVDRPPDLPIWSWQRWPWRGRREGNDSRPKKHVVVSSFFKFFFEGRRSEGVFVPHICDIGKMHRGLWFVCVVVCLIDMFCRCVANSLAGCFAGWWLSKESGKERKAILSKERSF